MQERDKKVKEIMEKEEAATKKLDEEAVHQLKKALSLEQCERVQQVAWQVGGSEAFATDAYLLKSLALTTCRLTSNPQSN